MMVCIKWHWILSHEQKTKTTTAKTNVIHVVGPPPPPDKAVGIISLIDRNYKYRQLFPTEEVS